MTFLNVTFPVAKLYVDVYVLPVPTFPSFVPLREKVITFPLVGTRKAPAATRGSWIMEPHLPRGGFVGVELL